MNIQIVIICLSCHHKNREELGMPGFELLQFKFDYFSDAHKHMLEHPDHTMSFEIETGADEE